MVHCHAPLLVLKYLIHLSKMLSQNSGSTRGNPRHKSSSVGLSGAHCYSTCLHAAYARPASLRASEDCCYCPLSCQGTLGLQMCATIRPAMWVLRSELASRCSAHLVISSALQVFCFTFRHSLMSRGWP